MEFQSHGVAMPLSSLSSGELVLFYFVSWLALHERHVAHRNVRPWVPAAFLIDEGDLHFHPSYTKIFFALMETILAANPEASFFMVTHNAATVRLAPNNSVWIMQRDKTTSNVSVTPASKQHAISVLSDGLLTVVEDVHYVLVENKLDAECYSIVYNKLIHTQLLPTGSRLRFVEVGVKSVAEDQINELKEMMASLKKHEVLTGNAELAEQLRKMEAMVKRMSDSNDTGGGCSQIEKRAAVSEWKSAFDDSGLGIIAKTEEAKGAHAPEIIWSLMDRDKGRSSKDALYALDVYSIECHLCSPLHVFSLMAVDQRYRPERYPSNEPGALQKETDAVASLLKQADLDSAGDAALQSKLSSMVQYVLERLLKDATLKQQQAVSAVSSNSAPVNVPGKKDKKDQKGKPSGTFTDGNHKLLVAFVDALQHDVPMHTVPLCNGMEVPVPVVFLDGLTSGSRRGHRLLEVLAVVLGVTEHALDTRLKSALEAVPAKLLPNNESFHDIAQLRAFETRVKKWLLLHQGGLSWAVIPAFLWCFFGVSFWRPSQSALLLVPPSPVVSPMADAARIAVCPAWRSLLQWMVCSQPIQDRRRAAKGGRNKGTLDKSPQRREEGSLPPCHSQTCVSVLFPAFCGPSP
jgi:hypothetical protein